MKYIILLSLLIISSISIDDISANLPNDYPNSAIKYDAFEKIFRGRGMNKAELQETFRIMDINDSGMIDPKEFKYFHKLFIKDFESCSDGWKIPAGKAKDCIIGQEWMKFLRLDEELRESVSYEAHENEKESAE
jgi:Ca2+-binding EF-hand superfamily protein